MTLTELMNSLILSSPINANPNQILLILIMLSFLTGLFLSWLMFWYLCNKLIAIEARMGELNPKPEPPLQRQRTVKDLKVLLFNTV